MQTLLQIFLLPYQLLQQLKLSVTSKKSLIKKLAEQQEHNKNLAQTNHILHAWYSLEKTQRDKSATVDFCKNTTEHTYCPINEEDVVQITLLIDELRKTLLTRTDGLNIKVTRSKDFPQLDGKDLIVEAHIKTWDIAA